MNFEETTRRELPLLYRVARRLTSDPVEAEDLIAQALLRASIAWPGFDGEHPRSWLIKILRNCYLGLIRRRTSRPAEVKLDPDTLADEPWNDVDWTLCGPLLLDAVERLPAEYRLAVVLFDIEELSYEEAAAAMGVSVGTAKSRVYRGRRLLRAYLAGLAEETK